jgi:hypothetical protein
MDFWYQATPPSTEPIATLPYVSVLEWWFVRHDRCPPMLNLPSLQHMRYWGCHSPSKFPFQWITPFSKRGLRSLVLGITHHEIEAFVLPWSTFPHLEELACVAFRPQFDEPIPIQHPLKRVWFPTKWSFSSYESLVRSLLHGEPSLKADLPRDVYICDMVWGPDGVPSHTPRGEDWVDARQKDIEEMGKFCSLVNESAKRGIRTFDRNHHTVWG